MVQPTEVRKPKEMQGRESGAVLNSYKTKMPIRLQVRMLSMHLESQVW